MMTTTKRIKNFFFADPEQLGAKAFGPDEVLARMNSPAPEPPGESPYAVVAGYVICPEKRKIKGRLKRKGSVKRK